MDLQILGDALISLIPPALVGVLFYVIMRAIFRADSTERKVYAQMEAEMREAQAGGSSDKVAEPATGAAQPATPKKAKNPAKNG